MEDEYMTGEQCAWNVAEQDPRWGIIDVHCPVKAPLVERVFLGYRWDLCVPHARKLAETGHLADEELVRLGYPLYDEEDCGIGDVVS